MDQLGHGDLDDGVLLLGPPVLGEEVADHLGLGLHHGPGLGGVARDGQEAGRMATVDLDPHVVVVPVHLGAAVGQYAQASAAGTDLGVAAHGLDDLACPRGDGGALAAGVEVDAHHVLEAGQDQPQPVVARGVQAQRHGRAVVVAPALDQLGGQAAMVAVVGHLVVLLALGVPDRLPDGPAAQGLELWGDVGPFEDLTDWRQVWCCIGHCSTQQRTPRKGNNGRRG